MLRDSVCLIREALMSRQVKQQSTASRRFVLCPPVEESKREVRVGWWLAVAGDWRLVFFVPEWTRIGREDGREGACVSNS